MNSNKLTLVAILTVMILLWGTLHTRANHGMEQGQLRRRSGQPEGRIRPGADLL